MTGMPDPGRPLERSLLVTGDRIQCPRLGDTDHAACGGCPYFCRVSTKTGTLICSFPFLARDTYERRARRRDDVRIALGHVLNRN
jgi:hypothetical protein